VHSHDAAFDKPARAIRVGDLFGSGRRRQVGQNARRLNAQVAPMAGAGTTMSQSRAA
jgi:hypothetical protein